MLKPKATIIAALFIWQFGLVCQAPAIAQIDVMQMSGAGHDIRRFEIADGIFQFMTMRDSYVRQLNSVVIVNEKDVLVFDTNTRPSSARLILDEIRKITNKPIRYIVNSHSHPDHWSGSDVYVAAFPGLDIITTTQTRELMYQKAGVWGPRFTTELASRRSIAEVEARTGKRSDGTVITSEQKQKDEADLRDYASLVDETNNLLRVFPTIWFDKSMTFSHGGREFRFISVTGDQEGTVVLYLPKEKVLITGDAVSYPIPYVSSKPSSQIESLQMLSQLDIDIIIPGHGPAFYDKQFLLLELELIEGVRNEVSNVLQRGITTLDEVQQVVTASNLRERFAHGDKDLEERFQTRVKALVGYVMAEMGYK